MFTPSSEWQFLGWEVLDRETGEVVTDSIKFDDPTKLEARGTVISPRENLTIHPKCLLLPAVVSISPGADTPQLANTPIQITFNQPMESEYTSADSSIFNYNNISITYNGKSLEDRFENPYFDKTKQILTLKPKATDLKSFIEPLETKKIHVVLSDSIYISKNNTNLYLINKNASFDITYKSELDEHNPIIDDFFVTRFDGKTITEEQKFLPKALSDFANSEYEKNRAKDIVYIHGICHDDGSGIKKITVTEQQTNDIYGNEIISEKTTPLEFSPAEQSVFFEENNGVIEFLIEYKLESEAGAILLETSVFDACDNYSTKQIVVIRNTVDNFAPWFAVYNAGHLKTSPSSVSDFSNIKTIRVTSKDSTEENQYEEFYSYIYNYIRLSPDKIKIKCLYTDKDNTPRNEELEYDSNQEEWLYTLDNIDSVSGLGITVVISDDLGNTYSKPCSFPTVPVPVLISNTTTERKVAFYIEPDVYRINQNNYVDYIYLQTETKLASGSNSSFKFCAKNDGLLGELSPVYTYNSFDNIQSSLDNIVLKSNNATLTPYPCNEYYDDIAYTEVKISIAENSWDNDKYDSIFLKTSDNQKVVLEKGKTEFKFKKSTKDCFTYSYTFTVYGIKGNTMTSGTTGTITKLTNSQNDNCPPEITFTRKNYDTYNLSVTDVGSSPASVQLITKTGKPIELANSTIGFTDISVPAWLVEEEALRKSYNVVQLKATDTKGNSNLVERNVSKRWETDICGISLSSGTTNWNIKFNKVLWSARQYNFYIYVWNTSTNTWNAPNAYYNQHASGDSSDFIGSYSMTSNRFVKIITTKSEGNSSSSRFDECVDEPRYFYTSSSNTGIAENKFIIPINSESLFIASDVPVLIHTVATKKEYEECSLWNASDWERYHLHAGEKVLSFSSSDRFQKKYTIPVEEIREKGCKCYVVIAHFADGSVQMSEVMEI